MATKTTADPYKDHRAGVRALCEVGALQTLYEWRNKLEDGAEQGRTRGHREIYRELSRIAVEVVNEAIAEREALADA